MPHDLRCRKSSRLPTAVAVAVITAALVAAVAAAAPSKGATVPNQTDKVGSNRVAPVKVICPGGTSGKCSGTLALKTAKPVKQGSQDRTVALGHSSFSIAAGKSAAVRVRISSAGYALVKKGALGALATASSSQGGGHQASNTTAITLKKKSACNPAVGPCY